MNSHEQLRREWKARLVEAHRRGDWNLAVKLSRHWEQIKRAVICRWPGCGRVLSGQTEIRRGRKRGEFCGVHWRMAKRQRCLAGAVLKLTLVMNVFGQVMSQSPTVPRHYHPAVVAKGSALLVAKATISPPPMIYITVTLPLTNTIQFSPDLRDWTTLQMTNQPPFTVSFPATNGVGFFRDVTESTYGPSSIQTSTNAPTP